MPSSSRLRFTIWAAEIQSLHPEGTFSSRVSGLPPLPTLLPSRSAYPAAGGARVVAVLPRVVCARGEPLGLVGQDQAGLARRVDVAELRLVRDLLPVDRT